MHVSFHVSNKLKNLIYEHICHNKCLGLMLALKLGIQAYQKKTEIVEKFFKLN